MERLTEQEKRQVRDQVFTPGAKFVGTLLFENESKFAKKLDAWCAKQAKSTGWKVKSYHKLANNIVKVSFYVRVAEGREPMNLDVVVEVKKKNS